MLDIMYELPSSKRESTIRITRAMVEENGAGLERLKKAVENKMSSQDPNSNAEMIRNIPLIPLRDLVIFPSTLVPFIIGASPRSSPGQGPGAGQAHLPRRPDGRFHEQPDAQGHLFPGGDGQDHRTVKSDDKNVKVIVEAKKRARVIEYLSTFPITRSWRRSSRRSRPEPRDQRAAQEGSRAVRDYLKLNQNANIESIIPALRDTTTSGSPISSPPIFTSPRGEAELLETINTLERVGASTISWRMRSSRSIPG